MKRRVLSLITALTLCLNLCPLGVLAADGGTDDALCPHHPAHTDECGYAPPVSGQECTHHHGDSCYTVETGCVHTHTAQCCAPGGDEPELCTHTCTEDSGCIVRTLSCPHEHDESCGYAPAIPGVPCGFVCRICPVESLIGQLPSSVSPDSMERVGAQLSEIYDLYDGLTDEEQAQVDLSPCAALQEQMDGMDVQPLAIGPYDDDFVMNRDISAAEPHKVSVIYLFDTNGYTYTATSSDAIQVTETGVLTLRGTVKSTQNVGVRVMSGGSLSITDGTTDITGGNALYIEAGGKASLAGGTYIGKGRAIVAKDGDYAALLAPGYAYFDGNGNPLKPADVAAGLQTVSVGRCTSHQRGDYTPTSGAVTHSWVCPSCGTTETEACTFTFDQQGEGTCGLCGNVITVEVDRESLKELAYDGSVKPKDGIVTVKLDNGTPLAQDAYTVSYSTRADVGDASITVTVTVEIGAGHGTFTKDYIFKKDELQKHVLEWDTDVKPVSVSVPYTGSEVKKTELPPVKINIETSDSAALQSKLQYSCRVQGSGSAYTEGLPKNAGIYDVVVSLPGGPDYQAASSDPITLTIQPIHPVNTAPAAVKPTYNRSTQELVTPGTLNSAAAADGAEIQFATSQNGSYSTQIPTGVKAKGYDVWYKVVIPASAAGNYNAVGPTQISGVQILPKSITPVIEVSQTSYQYDGAKKEPKITVKDGNVVIEKDEDGKDQYTVTWTGAPGQTDDEILRVVGNYTAAIENVSNGNYVFLKTVGVEITEAVQDALHITGEPAHVYYGDTITGLEAIGGTGQGEVKWSISAGGAHTSIDAKTGVFTVKDTGSITVKAERIVPNYGTVSDTWTFNVEPKQVMAEVTVKGKAYDGTISISNANITAAVNPSDLVDPSDSFTISGLKGAYMDADVGIGKTVTLDKTGMTTTANTNKYTVSCPNAAAADITPRQVTVTVTLSDHDLQTDAKGWYYIFDNTEKRPAVTVTANDNGAQLKVSDYVVSYTNNKNAGTATVTVRNAAGGNYTFNDETVQFEIRKATAWLSSSPQAKVLRYTGAMQELVTVGTAVGGHVEYALDGGSFGPNIPKADQAGTYVVTYKAVGEGSYADSTVVGSVSVTIDPMEIVSPKITISGTYTYDGQPQKPSGNNVKVEDGTTPIPASEYTLAYLNNINAGTATVRVINANRGNYIVNGTAEFTIEKANITGITPPTGITSLPYNGTPQELVKAGAAPHGTMVYSLEEHGTYSPAIPTAKEVDTYPVWYMVQGDNNYNDSAAASVPASIVVNNVTAPQIQVTPEAVTFNGQKQEKPTVTVWDNNGFLIDGSEYTVTYAAAGGNDDLTQVGTYTLTITNKSGSNYSINDSSETFKILEAGQTPLTITGKREHVYYGDSFYLQTEGGDGTITWALTDSTVAEIDQTSGLLKVKGVGPVTVTATSKAPGYTDKTATWKIQVEKKPVTAVVTAEAKTYDGNTNAAVTAVLQQSDLETGDVVAIKLSGSFEDPSAGTDKKVNVDSANPTISGQNSDKYAIAYPATATASILKADINVDDTNQVTKPTLVTNSLEYTGQPQVLVTAGSSSVGALEYSLDGQNYSTSLPTGTIVGTYDVWYRVKGDSNHKDTAGEKLGTVAIVQQSVPNPTIEFSPSGASYDGSAHQPKVIVKDKNSLVIPEDEYTVDYGTGDWIKAGSYPVTVTGKGNGNYNISQTTATFIINPTGQPPLSIITGIPTDVCYGDSFSLGAAGGSGNGALHWSITGGNAADIDKNGVVKVTGTGPFTVEVYREAEGGYNQSNTVKVSFEAKPKTITPVVTAENKPYDGKTDATLHAAWKSGDLVGTDSIALTVTGGEFVTPDVGMNKQVKVTPGTPNGVSGNYIITWPDNTTASIYQVDAKVDSVPKANSLTYNGSAQALVTAGTTENNIGRIVYSLSQNGAYSENVPTAVDAGTYTVWYKVPGSVNYTGIPDPVAVEVKIEKATPSIDTSPTASAITSGQPLSTSQLTGGSVSGVSGGLTGTFAWAQEVESPVNGIEYDVIFTPTDTDNYNTATCKVAVTVNPSPGNSTGGGSGGTSSSGNNSSGGGTTADSTPEDSTQSTASVPADVQNGTARSTLGEAEGSQLVQKAVANQSSNVVITQEAAEDVTKAEVSIPASTMSQLHSETNADLTVSAPVADVTIPHEALDTLANAGGTVDVTAERIGDSVVLTVTAGGAAVESVPGGVTLSVPVEDAAPGTVAVLVHEDGTEETIRKSMVEDGKLNIPLDGSATIKIVDNSKDFADVSDASWAADAIAFASAHELFNGTSENTFSPDQPMSRGMLTTVLYNLEGRPKQEAASEFSDVSSDAWYADSVAWAAANGITNGYSNGSFGPNDNVTREQFAVMLWNYAGKPEAADAGLDFADADQISGYAQEALRWATEKGILDGYSSGRLDPKGMATRAQAALMLKNFMENT